MTALQYQNNIQPRRDQYGSDIAAALTGAQRLLKKRSLVVLISDFYSINWEAEMDNLCRKHDVIAIKVSDPDELPFKGLVTLEDPETGVRIEAPAGLDSFKDSWTSWLEERTIRWETQCKKSGAAFLKLSTTADAPSVLMKFFGSRSMNRYRNRKKK